MTGEQIEARREEILHGMVERNNGKWAGSRDLQTEEETKELAELRARSMVNSIMAYNGHVSNYDRWRWFKNADKILGIKRCTEIILSQIIFFKMHATVHYDIYTDCEGCSYNSVVWS